MGTVSRTVTIVAATAALLAAGCDAQPAEVEGDIEITETEPLDIETENDGEYEGDSGA